MIGVWWEEEEEGVAEDGQGSKESWLEWVVTGLKGFLRGKGKRMVMTRSVQVALGKTSVEKKRFLSGIAPIP